MGRGKVYLGFLALAAGITLVYPLLKVFEEKTLKRDTIRQAKKFLCLKDKRTSLTARLKFRAQPENSKGNRAEYKRKSEVLESYRNSFPVWYSWGIRYLMLSAQKSCRINTAAGLL